MMWDRKQGINKYWPNAVAIDIYSYSKLCWHNRPEPCLSMPISKLKKIDLVVCKTFGPEIA